MKKIAVVIGHTNKQKGAKLVAPFHLSEYEYNKVLANLILNYSSDLEQVTVKLFFRDGIGIARAYEQVERWGADCSIELHFNSYVGKVSGATVLYGDKPDAALLAQLAQTAIVGVIGNRDRSIKSVALNDRGGVSLNSPGRVPRILIEPFFGSSLKDARQGLALIQTLAQVLFSAAVDFVYR